jgi:indolepyruvate ferredoxin oxidoreductase beta subunit
MSVIIGAETYPDDVLEEIEKHVKAKVVDATRLAGELGNEKAANMILLGTIIKAMGLEHIDWDAILEANMKPQFLELNKKALQTGINAVA